MKSRRIARLFIGSLFLAGLVLCGEVFPKTTKIKMTTNIPANIITPNKIKTSLGTLEFFDGMPSKATISKLYDNLDLIRAVDVFLNAIVEPLGSGNGNSVLTGDGSLIKNCHGTETSNPFSGGIVPYHHKGGPKAGCFSG